MKPATFTARVAAIVDRCPLPSVHCSEDTMNHRIVIQFPEMPDRETCDLMKRSGFKFRGGSTQAWVRPLTPNGRTAARFVMAQLTERTPEDNA